MYSFNLVRKFVVLCGFLGLSALAQAAPITLNDGNASFTFDDENPCCDAFSYNFLVDGTDHLYENLFFIRLAGDSQEYLIDSSRYTKLLTIATSNQALLSWIIAPGLTMNIDYILNGGAAGSQSAVLTQNITIRSEFGNTFSLFSYADYEANADIFSNSAEFNGSDTICQRDGLNTVSACANADVAPDFWEISTYSTTRDTLNDSFVDNLANTGSPFGPGDATFAMQWNKTLQDTETFSLTITQTISPVSAPNVFAIILLSLMGLAIRKR